MITSKSRLQAEELVKLSNYFGAAGLYLPQRFGVMRVVFLAAQEAFSPICAGYAYLAGLERKAYRLRGWSRGRSHNMQVSNAFVDRLRDCMRVNPEQRVVGFSGRSFLLPTYEVFVEEGGHAPSICEIVFLLLKNLGAPLPSCNEGGSKNRSDTAKCLNPSRPYLPSILVDVDAHGVKPHCIRQTYASNDGSSEPPHRLPIDGPHLTSPVLNAEIVCAGIA